ncbi:MAG: metal ABC transporter permease [bacterium]|nr:metal ABC transporter permease [bacterium]
MDFATAIELFGWALAALAATAVAAPLAGAFLYGRGTAFQGVLLPQLATFGVALGFALHPRLFGGSGAAGELPGGVEPSPSVLLAWAAVVTTVGALLLAWLRARERPGADAEGARVAGAFAIASGGALIAAQLAPFGGLHVEALLHGEALAVGASDAALVMGASALVVLGTVWSWRDLTLVGQDPAFARALGLGTARCELALAVGTCMIVILGTLTLGPLPLFALLVLPPLAARRRAGSMATFLALSSALGLVGAALGAGLSFGADLPLGPSVVAGQGAVLVLVVALGLLRR